MFISLTLFYFNSLSIFCLSSPLLLSFIIFYLSSTPDEDYVLKAFVFLTVLYVSSYRWVHFSRAVLHWVDSSSTHGLLLMNPTVNSWQRMLTLSLFLWWCRRLSWASMVSCTFSSTVSICGTHGNNYSQYGATVNPIQSAWDNSWTGRTHVATGKQLQSAWSNCKPNTISMRQQLNW